MADESCSTQLIDGDGTFNVDGLEKFTKTVKLAECRLSYAVVAIMGPQSSGKSTLLNHLFNTNFKEMDAFRGRSQTTKGIWMARCRGIETCTVVMDLEGSDGRERGEAPPDQSPVTPNWTIDVTDIRTVKVGNISLSASEHDIREFFSFSGDIFFIEMRSESERTQSAYVTFKNSQGADTAVLLTGATIVDLPVTVMLEENYHLPPEAYKSSQIYDNSEESTIRKAEDMMSSMLAKGFVLGKDALARAKSFDERHGLTSNASATITNLDSKIGLSEKISMTTTIVNEKVREVDEKYQVSQITRSAFSAAEQKASSAGNTILSSPYVLSGASWVSSAFNKVAKAAGDVGSMTKEKVEKAEEEKKETIYNHNMGLLNEFAQLHLDESYGEGPATVPVGESP